MTRLIDADALMRKAVEKFYITNYFLHISTMIDNAPTIDAVPIVRCKDCKGSEVFQNDSSGVMARYCKVFTLKRMVADDDFRSYGERKGDD